jgi:hypothetical protein
MDYGCAAELEDRTARGERVGLLGGREVHNVVEEGGAAGQEKGGLGERWTPRWKRAVLLGRRDMDDGCAAGWEGEGLQEGRELDS